MVNEDNENGEFSWMYECLPAPPPRLLFLSPDRRRACWHGQQQQRGGRHLPMPSGRGGGSDDVDQSISANVPHRQCLMVLVMSNVSAVLPAFAVPSMSLSPGRRRWMVEMVIEGTMPPQFQFVHRSSGPFYVVY